MHSNKNHNFEAITEKFPKGETKADEMFRVAYWKFRDAPLGLACWFGRKFVSRWLLRCASIEKAKRIILSGENLVPDPAAIHAFNEGRSISAIASADLLTRGSLPAFPHLQLLHNP